MNLVQLEAIKIMTIIKFDSKLRPNHRDNSTSDLIRDPTRCHNLHLLSIRNV
jgi:hypothetical protein